MRELTDPENATALELMVFAAHQRVYDASDPIDNGTAVSDAHTDVQEALEAFNAARPLDCHMPGARAAYELAARRLENACAVWGAQEVLTYLEAAVAYDALEHALQLYVSW